MESNNGLTTNQLVSLIRLTGMVPDAPSVFKPEDIISLLNVELSIGIVPSILQTKEEYFVFDIEQDLVANKSKYLIPSRAISGRLRDMYYKDSGNNEYNMTKISSDDRFIFDNNIIDDTYYRKYYLEGSSICLIPKIGANPSGSIVFKIYLRPNKLVKDEEVAVISSINRTTGAIVFSNLPSKFTSSKTYDFVKSGSPHNILGLDIPLTSLNTSTKTVVVDVDSIPSDLVEGDYFAIAGETCIPNIPTELHPVLAQRVRHQIMEAQGDSQAYQAAGQRLSEMEGKTSILTENRVDGSPTRIVSRSIMFGLGRARRRLR